MNDIETTTNQKGDEFVPLWRGMDILGVKKSTFFYLVNTKKITVHPGAGPKDNRYSLQDILREKAERKARKPSSATFTLDWMYPRDLPAALELDYTVFDRRMIASLDVYESWIARNNHIAMCAYDRKDRRKMLAYICMLPLPETVIMQVLTGERDETDIKAEEIEDYSRLGAYTLLANSAVTHPDRPDLLYQVLNAIMQHWLHEYPERYIARVYAQAASPKGDVLIQKFYFAPMYLLHGALAQPVKDAYVLDLSRPGASKVIQHFQCNLQAKIVEGNLPALTPSPLPVLQASQSRQEGQGTALQPSELPRHGDTQNRFLERKNTGTARPGRQRATESNAPVAGSGEGPELLPNSLVSWRSFADLHAIPQTTVQKAVETGRLAVVRGSWKQGRTFVKAALDAAGRRQFWEMYSSNNPHFHACPDCPHVVG